MFFTWNNLFTWNNPIVEFIDWILKKDKRSPNFEGFLKPTKNVQGKRQENLNEKLKGKAI